MPKKENVYSQHLTSDFYNACPKAIFAALAVSLMANHLGCDVDVVEPKLLQEWYTLHMQGVVPQCPPGKLWKEQKQHRVLDIEEIANEVYQSTEDDRIAREYGPNY